MKSLRYSPVLLPGFVLLARLVFLTGLVILISACASQIDRPLADQNIPQLILASIPLGDNKLPDFSQQRDKRPTTPGTIYHLVYKQQDRVTTSYEIAISKGRKSRIDRPLEVIYEWTSKGFVAGLETLDGAQGIDEMVVVVALPVVGAIAGFVVGVFASIPEAYNELGNLLTTSKERLVSQSDYQYDRLNRLVLIDKHLPGKKGRKLIRTEFHYEGIKRTPYEVILFSYPEDKQRILRPVGY